MDNPIAKKMHIHQPNPLKPMHCYHNRNVLAFESLDAEKPRCIFLVGDELSLSIPNYLLVSGWKDIF